MEVPGNKETLNLLQISDDSKSLSDLELPEIMNQRKRKVRRKTRPRTATINNQKDLNNSNQCNRLIMWIAIFLTCCWLLTLSYMIAVIHAENLRLEVQIKKLSVTSQNLPEALQKWHETSKNLEQNQTAIYGKITELQHSLENLSSDLAQYKAKLNEKKDYSKDEKFVANFGAKIEAVTVDVEGMKERFSEFQKNQINFKNDMQQLKSNFTAAVANASMSSNNSSSNCSEEISVVKQLLLDQIKAISANLSTANDTFSQKNKGMDEELLLHKRSLEALSETVANTTSHVTSIENDWTTYKTKAINFESFSNKVDTEIMNLRNSTNFLENSVEEVRTTCNKIHTDMQHDFDELKQKSMNAKKDTPAITKVILSNEDNKTPSELSPPTTKNTEDTKKNINLDKSAFQNSTNATINSTTELVGMKR